MFYVNLNKCLELFKLTHIRTYILKAERKVPDKAELRDYPSGNIWMMLFANHIPENNIYSSSSVIVYSV